MNKVRRLRGVAAMSAAALATLGIAGPVSAVDPPPAECITCEPGHVSGPANAFWKLADKDFPGATETVVFQKWTGLTAFDKLSGKGFPGATDEIFEKFGD